MGAQLALLGAARDPGLMSPSLPEDLRERLAAVRTIGAITGAGVSVESGLPTYRGQGGVYDDPDEGDRTIEDLSIDSQHHTPVRTWRRLVQLARSASSARPNPAHEALVRLERAVERFVLLTQNVDRLHQQAGSRNVIDIHGDLSATLCVSCGRRGQMAEVLHLDLPATCEACGKALRADVVLFGEMLPMDKLKRLRQEFLAAAPDLLIVAGTTALFPYIVEPVLFARATGRLTVEINPEETVLSEQVDFSLRGPAGVYLPLLAEAIVVNQEKTPLPPS